MFGPHAGSDAAACGIGRSDAGLTAVTISDQAQTGKQKAAGRDLKITNFLAFGPENVTEMAFSPCDLWCEFE